MSNYKSKHTGAQVDEAVSKVLNGEVGGGATPNWNAQLGEPGYIENKPFGDTLNTPITEKYDFEFVSEEGDAPPVYVYKTQIEYSELYIKYPHFCGYDDDTQFGYDVAKLDAKNELYVYRNSDFRIEAKIHVIPPQDEMEDYVYELYIGTYNYENLKSLYVFKDRYTEILKPISNAYLPDTILKTTPQSLSTKDKNQVKENLGISNPDWNAQEGEAGYIKNKPNLDLSSDSLFEKGDSENSAVLKGGDNQVISEGGVALGENNFVGLKGWYYKAIQFNTTNNITFLYLTKTQQVPIIVTSASEVEQEKDIVVALSNNDIVSVVNDSKYDNKYKVSTNEISSYGRIGLKSVDSNIPFPFDKVNIDDELNNGIFDPEDYSIYCFQKPNIGIADIGQDSFASGYNNKAINCKATAFGYNNHAYGKFSFVEGRGNEAGYAAHAEGRDCVAKGEMSHAGGLTTHANGKASFSHGQDTRANGHSSFAMGYAAKANGDQSISLGYNTSAEGAHSVALGNNTQAIGNVSHAENAYTVAEGRASHAEGFNSKVHLSEGSLTDNYERGVGYAAHAEGHTTQSIGCGAHSEGGFTTALGNFTHAEGYRTHAKGSLSHAEGKYTKTTNEAEHASGKYNVSNSDTQFSIGIGTSESDRKNAFEIMQDGKHYIYGVGGYDGTNPDKSSDLASTIKNLDTKISNLDIDPVVWKYMMNPINLAPDSFCTNDAFEPVNPDDPDNFTARFKLPLLCFKNIFSVHGSYYIVTDMSSDKTKIYCIEMGNDTITTVSVVSVDIDGLVSFSNVEP